MKLNLVGKKKGVQLYTPLLKLFFKKIVFLKYQLLDFANTTPRTMLIGDNLTSRFADKYSGKCIGEGSFLEVGVANNLVHRFIGKSEDNSNLCLKDHLV